MQELAWGARTVHNSRSSASDSVCERDALDQEGTEKNLERMSVVLTREDGWFEHQAASQAFRAISRHRRQNSDGIGNRTGVLDSLWCGKTYVKR